MLAVLYHAAATAKGGSFEHTFAFWNQLDTAQAVWGEGRRYPPLLYRFGVALIERAVIDALCRALQQPFWRLLRENVFGIALKALHPDLQDSQPADWLPAEPLDRVFLRHTVGLGDPLSQNEIAAGDKLDDGLPQSLEACIRAYGLCHFKIKVTADGDTSISRLRRVLQVLRDTVHGEYRFSLDGNESFSTVEAFMEFWNALEEDALIREALPSCIFVEQPFHRQSALSKETGAALKSWDERPVLIIDESDDSPQSLRDALANGYHGISHKNCKGIIKGVADACLLAKHRSEGKRGVMSGEDLANIGPVAVCQDLAVQAALGNASMERNGHHYFRGLSMWPDEISREMLNSHPDLYTEREGGLTTLDVRQGQVSLASVNAAPLGVVPLRTFEFTGQKLAFAG